MIKIFVKDEAEKVFAQTAMEREVMYNLNLNGADFEVEINQDFAGSIYGGDELVGASLMTVVFESPSDD